MTCSWCGKEVDYYANKGSTAYPKCSEKCKSQAKAAGAN